MTDPFLIRPARPDEAAALTELALRSKAYWEYAPTLLEAHREDLTLTAEYILTCPVYVLEVETHLIGFYALHNLDDGAVELQHLFVDPEAIGGGYGRKLWQHAVQTAKHLGFRYMFIDSDPYAETFYQAMGAQRIGQSESSVPGIMQPLMRYTLG